MDLLIKNMEMPKSCDECFFYTMGNTFSRNKCFLLKENPWSPLWDGDVPPSCPLVALPEHHGRLKDADAMLEKQERIVLPDDLTYTIAHGILKQIIEDAETIVEATE